MNYSKYITSSSKKIAWRKYDFLNKTPPKTSDGKKYLCLDLHGNMQVCTWDGICNEWVYCNGDLLSDEMLEAASDAVSDAVCKVLEKHLPKNKQHILGSIADEIFELSLDQKGHCGLTYFDYVEWYLELPDPPAIDWFDLEDGEDVQAGLVDKEFLLMEHLERAVKDFVSQSARKIKDAP